MSKWKCQRIRSIRSETDWTNERERARERERERESVIERQKQQEGVREWDTQGQRGTARERDTHNERVSRRAAEWDRDRERQGTTLTRCKYRIRLRQVSVYKLYSQVVPLATGWPHPPTHTRSHTLLRNRQYASPLAGRDNPSLKKGFRRSLGLSSTEHLGFV